MSLLEASALLRPSAFSGIGRLRTDTHHFRAALDTPRTCSKPPTGVRSGTLLAGSNAQLMIGHAICRDRSDAGVAFEGGWSTD